MCGQSVDHPGAEDMGHVAHHRVQAPAIDEGLQLVLDVVRLLAREAGHRIRPYEAARRQPMTGFTITSLGFEFLRPNGFGLCRAAGLAVLRLGPGAEDDGKQNGRRESPDNLHDLPPKNFRAIGRSAPSARRERSGQLRTGRVFILTLQNLDAVFALPHTPAECCRARSGFT